MDPAACVVQIHFDVTYDATGRHRQRTYFRRADWLGWKSVLPQ
jgi:hypothetical protein